MSELVHLSGGVVVPRAAFDLLLELERAGHKLTLDGPDIVIEPARGIPLDPAALADLRRWKPHVRMLMAYVCDDSHLYRDSPPATERRAAS